MLMFFAISITVGILFVGLPVLLIWIVGRYTRREAAMVIGVVAIAYFVYSIVHTYQVCNAPPVFPDAGDGPVDFPCDAPGGIFDHLFIWVVGPVQVVLLLVTTSVQYLQFRRER